MIPRVAHFIWLGGPLPDHLAELCETFREHHPEWAIWWWNEQAIDRFGLEHRDIYDRAAEYVPSDSVYQLQSDIARVEILHQFGGAYIDCDLLWHAPVDELLDGHEVVTPWERQWVNVANGFIATVPGHPVLREVIDGLPGRAEVHNRTPVTRSARARAAAPGSVSAASPSNPTARISSFSASGRVPRRTCGEQTSKKLCFELASARISSYSAALIPLSANTCSRAICGAYDFHASRWKLRTTAGESPRFRIQYDRVSM